MGPDGDLLDRPVSRYLPAAPCRDGPTPTSGAQEEIFCRLFRYNAHTGAPGKSNSLRRAGEYP